MRRERLREKEHQEKALVRQSVGEWCHRGESMIWEDAVIQRWKEDAAVGAETLAVFDSFSTLQLSIQRAFLAI